MKGYRWPNAGVPNLGRIKQAFWDAFHGTRQPLFAEGGRAGGLKFRLDEVGWQVRVHPSAQHAYEGVENIQTDRRGVAGAHLRRADPLPGLRPERRLAALLRPRDEPDLDRWQAGLIRADGTLRPAYGAVKTTFAQTQGRCAGKKHSWRHTETVLGARAKFPSMGRFRPVEAPLLGLQRHRPGERPLPGRHLPRRHEPEDDGPPAAPAAAACSARAAWSTRTGRR